MQKFTDFALEITLPPNPNRAIDDSLNAAQQAGRNFFFGPRRSDGLATDAGRLQLGFTCNGCHELDPPEMEFGTSKRASFENEEQIIKIPHLRNLYQKIGMFGGVDVVFEDPLNEPFQGDQIRGFGFLHDGSIPTLFRFLNATVFSTHSFGGPAVGFQSNQQRLDVEQYLLAFDTNLKPAVGQQVTLDASGAATAGPRIDLLEARAAAGDCDLVAKGTVGGTSRGWLRLASGKFQSDRGDEAAIGSAALRALAATSGQEITFTCVPPGSGLRIGIDRDEDGFFDQTEIDAGSDPSDAASVPAAVSIGATQLRMTADVKPPIDDDQRTLSFTALTRTAGAGHHVTVPAPGSPNDPTVAGATLRLYNAAGATADDVTIDLPANGWKAIGSGIHFRGYRFTGPKAGPVISVVVKPDSLALRGGKASFAYTLDEPAQGSVALRLQLGADRGWCTVAPARTKGSPPSSAFYDRAGRFVGAPDSAAPATCPAPPV